MVNPFLITGPAHISFSGGRTSAMMLYKILEAHNGKLPSDVYVTFCNTGKEKNETLDFVHKIETEWSVKIYWLEFCWMRPAEKISEDKKIRREQLKRFKTLLVQDDQGLASPRMFKIVNYDTASRHGEPFTILIQKKRFLPNPVTRYCTMWLKIELMKRFMFFQGYRQFDVAIGIRYDEPSRLVKMRAKSDNIETKLTPLADAKITVNDVMNFWQAQPFDLQIRPDQGNCDLCFLKGTEKKIALIRENPLLANWWIEQENLITIRPREKQRTFRHNSMSYQTMREMALTQRTVFDLMDIDDLGDCVCKD